VDATVLLVKALGSGRTATALPKLGEFNPSSKDESSREYRSKAEDVSP
jgi:hypothetical protein